MNSNLKLKIKNYLVVGLGNPDSKYVHTLHNVGFLALDFLNRVGPHKDLKDLGGPYPIELNKGLNPNQNASKALEGSTLMDSGSDPIVSFLKPSSGMNLSGIEVSKTLKYHNLTASDLIVIHDDIDISFGIVKSSFGSGSGGHKGVQSIIDSLGTKDFWRIRIGVMPKNYNPSLHKAEDFVLTNFSKTQLLTLNNKTFPSIIPYLKQIIGRDPICG